MQRSGTRGTCIETIQPRQGRQKAKRASEISDAPTGAGSFIAYPGFRYAAPGANHRPPYRGVFILPQPKEASLTRDTKDLKQRAYESQLEIAAIKSYSGFQFFFPPI